MSPVADRYGPHLGELGDTPLARMLIYGEQRFWLLTALGILEKSDWPLPAGATAVEWGELCQRWRLAFEGATRLVQSDQPSLARSTYVSTIFGAFANALLRIDRPTVHVAEVWCGGQLRRLEIGKATSHGLSLGLTCPCVVFDEAIFQLESAAHGGNPWARWTPAKESLAWAGLGGLCGPHVTRLVHGVPGSLEEHVGLGHAGSAFDWGSLGSPAARLATAILSDAEQRSTELRVDRFAREVLLPLAGGQEFVLRGSEVLTWSAHQRSWRGIVPRGAARVHSGGRRLIGRVRRSVPAR